VGLAVLLVAVGLIFFLWYSGGGSEFDDVEGLRVAMADSGHECSDPQPESPREEGGSEAQVCELAGWGPVGLRVFSSDEEYEALIEDLEGLPTWAVVGDNWVIDTGGVADLPEQRRQLEDLAEDLDAEVVHAGD
jgi:nitrogen fixation-related uncharacterized protein